MEPYRWHQRSHIIFYLLVVYVFLQFGWWTYLMFNLHKQIFEQKKELAGLHFNKQDSELSIRTTALSAQFKKRVWMVIGESVVFLLLLFIGARAVIHSFKTEIDLARQQKNFLLSITHELKSPLAVTKLNLQTILNRQLSKEEEKNIVSAALEETERLNTLVDNILLAARIESRQYSLLKERFNISEWAADVFGNAYKKPFPQKLELTIEPEIVCNGDKNALQVIIGNLLENAGKYSPDDSTIRVTISRTGGGAGIRVSDEGIGVADEEKENIFKKFYRMGNEETRSQKGTGLGLYIIRNLVDMHQGKVHVKNNIPKGSVFEIII